ALALADELLVSRGGLEGLAMSHPEEIAEVPGVGEAKAAVLSAAFELARRATEGDRASRLVLRRPEDLARVVELELGNARREIVLAIILDASHRLRRLVRISEGSVDQAMLPAREVLNAVLRNDGVAFALAHNHPSGDLAPSQLDIQATDRLQKASVAVGLRFLDHLIVEGERWVSLRASGVLGELL
ncbi:MAG: JAB domain-containing protein, partial [Actinomycetota bacterium]